jgi:Na+-transporting NADH:ubiquinone oxidoreductase subunit NqrC
VRNKRWRAQFSGKRASDALQFGREIKNISGATLSSRHVTDGVRRVLATYALVLARG